MLDLHMETRFELLYTCDSYGPFPPMNHGGGKPTEKSAAEVDRPVIRGHAIRYEVVRPGIHMRLIVSARSLPDCDAVKN
jgi:hypothetical protein